MWGGAVRGREGEMWEEEMHKDGEETHIMRFHIMTGIGRLTVGVETHNMRLKRRRGGGRTGRGGGRGGGARCTGTGRRRILCVSTLRGYRGGGRDAPGSVSTLMVRHDINGGKRIICAIVGYSGIYDFLCLRGQTNAAPHAAFPAPALHTGNTDRGGNRRAGATKTDPAIRHVIGIRTRRGSL